jgi:hypothetical protein
MIKFPIATNPPAVRSKDAPIIGLFYAFVIVVLAVAQLYSFDDFIGVVQSFALPGGAGFVGFLAAYIVVNEVFSLPFLLRMKVSRLMRAASMLSVAMVGLIWTGISVWLVVGHSVAANVGYLGGVVSVPVDGRAVLVGVEMCLLSGWMIWRMWPFGGRKV